MQFELHMASPRINVGLIVLQGPHVKVDYHDAWMKKNSKKTTMEQVDMLFSNFRNLETQVTKLTS